MATEIYLCHGDDPDSYIVRWIRDFINSDKGKEFFDELDKKYPLPEQSPFEAPVVDPILRP